MKILHASYDSTATPNKPLSAQTFTIGNSLKIANRRCHYDIRKFSFGRIIESPLWNSLPEDILLHKYLIHLKTNLTNTVTSTNLDLFGKQRLLEPELEVK